MTAHAANQLGDIHNRIGLVVDFISFWLAAPELIDARSKRGMPRFGFPETPRNVDCHDFHRRVPDDRSLSGDLRVLTVVSLRAPAVLVIVWTTYLFGFGSPKRAQEIRVNHGGDKGVRQGPLIAGAVLFTIPSYSSLRPRHSALALDFTEKNREMLIQR